MFSLALVRAVRAGMRLIALLVVSTCTVASAQVAWNGSQSQIGQTYAGTETMDPIGVAVDKYGIVYISGVGNGTGAISQFLPTPDGFVQSGFNLNTSFSYNNDRPSSTAYNIGVDANDTLWIPAATATLLYYLRPGGGLNYPEFPRQYVYPQTAEVGMDGAVYATDNVVDVVWKVVGNVATALLKNISIQAVTADAAGNIFALESIQEINYAQVIRYANDGNWTASTVTSSLLPDNYSGITGLAVDRNGIVYVVDPGHGRLLRELPKPGGGWTEQVLAGSFQHPVGLAIDPHGDLVMTDLLAGDIYAFQLHQASLGSQFLATSGLTTLTFHVGAGTTIGSIQTVDEGQQGSGILNSDQGTCVAKTYTSSTDCTVVVSFYPGSVGTHKGAVNFYDGSGNPLTSLPVSGVGLAPVPALAAGLSTSVAFTGPSQSNVLSLTFDPQGNAYVVGDGQHYAGVWEYSPSSGFTNPTQLSAMSDLNQITIDGNGNLFATVGNLWSTTPTSASIVEIPIKESGNFGSIVTVASGLGGLNGIVADQEGNIFALQGAQSGETNSGILWELPRSPGGFGPPIQIANGRDAYPAQGIYNSWNGVGFSSTGGLAIDASGNLFVASATNSTESGSTGKIFEFTKASGYLDFSVVASGLPDPVALVVEPNGNLLVQTYGIFTNAPGELLEIPLATGSSTPQVLATGVLWSGGMAVDRQGNIYSAEQFDEVATNGGGAILMTARNTSTVAFAQTEQNTLSADSPKTVQVENFGNSTLALTGLNYPANFVNLGGNNACTASTQLWPGAQCSLNIGFEPATAVPSGKTQASLTGFVQVKTTQGTLTVSVSGTETNLGQGAVSPGMLSFGSQATNFPGPVQYATFMNIGTSPLSLSGVAVSGTAFQIASNTCPASLLGGASCKVGIQFDTATVGAQAGQLTFTDNGTITQQQAVTLLGTGTAPVATARLAFTPAPVSTAWVGGNPGTVTVASENASGSLNPGAADVVTLKVTGPNSFSESLTATEFDAVATFNLDGVIFPAAGTYTITASGATGTAAASQTIAVQAVSTGGNNTQTFTVAIAHPGTLYGSYLTPGSAFVPGSGGTCTNGTAYTAGQTCTVKIAFRPTVAGMQASAVKLLTSSGTVMGTVYLSGLAQGEKIAFGNGIPTTIDSNLSGPAGIAVDANNDLFLADTLNKRIVEVPYQQPQDVYQTPIVLATGLGAPTGLAVDGAGNVFYTDTTANAVVELPCVNGLCQKFGAPVAIPTGLANSWSAPAAVTVDAEGNLYVADTGNLRVLKLPWTGTSYGAGITLGSANAWQHPTGVAVDPSGNVFVADSLLDAVSELPFNGSVYAAPVKINQHFQQAQGVSTDSNGNVYIADSTGGTITRVLKTATGFATPATLVSGLSTPAGLASDVYGNLYYTASKTNVAVKLDLADAPSYTFPTPTVENTIDTADGPYTLEVASVGNQTLAFTSSSPQLPGHTFPNNTADKNLCTSSSAVAQGSWCDVSVNFAPSSNGSFTGQLQLIYGTPIQHETIDLAGTGVLPTTPTPAFLPAGGTYTSVQTVTISDSIKNASIYYTTDGTTPTQQSTRYQGSITVGTNETLEAVALAPGDALSTAAIAIYTFPPAATPKVTPATGTYNAPITVTITDTTPNAIIYYTTDYSIPTTSSPVYKGSFGVSSADVVRAIAVATGYSPSAVATASYAFVTPPAIELATVLNIATPDATFEARVEAFNLAGSVWFTYGKSSTALTSQTPYVSVPAGGLGVASVTVKTLAGKTTYYYQAWVETSAGISSGPIQSFTTN
jgi:sugar lactone lactonase YvrE